jgi:predicted neuraminidase
MNTKTLAFVLLLAVVAAAADVPFHTAELIFPLEHWHNHASSVVELPNGDLFVCWYHGSGERTADDVIIQAARKHRDFEKWNPRYTLADVPDFPDTNPVLFLDSGQRLWLLWPVILANEWHTALMKYKISSDYYTPGIPPRWEISEELLFIPRNFAAKVKRVITPALREFEPGSGAEKYLKYVLGKASDKYFSRLGWMTRAHPLELPSGRILVPLYSDGYSFSLIAITDDGGQTWSASEPLVGWGSIQPTLARRRDGVLVAYMRDAGPPPKRLHVSTSEDDGVTWSPVVDSELPNPGSAAEVIVLSDGTWALVLNDTERGRHSLAVSLSDDEGKTWKWTRHLELDTRERGAGSFHYPSIIQARDASLHVSYSYFLNHLPKDAPRKSIKHAHFNVAWVKQGD